MRELQECSGDLCGDMTERECYECGDSVCDDCVYHYEGDQVCQTCLDDLEDWDMGDLAEEDGCE